MAATGASPETTWEVRSTTLPQAALQLLPAPFLRIAPSERRVVQPAPARQAVPAGVAGTGGVGGTGGDRRFGWRRLWRCYR